ncbi:tetratricopeptide repeat protein, partial [Bradyrhizobium sp. dw_411]|uniref:tetratricopeptide repeat protein n=1 Tax=Bradyrhizobium sp. dw_411 TaxID=2720082 RepID=UPI0031FF1C42
MKAPMTRRGHGPAPEKPPIPRGTENLDALCEAGLHHMQAGRYLDAHICCERVLAINNSHADTLHLMGLLSHQAGQHDLALAWMTRAIQNDPKPQYLGNLGTMLLRQERYEDALKAFDKAIQLKPEDAELWEHLGNTLLRLGRPDDALLTFQHVLKLNPRHRDAAYKSGQLLYNLKRFEEALKHFDLCDELQPSHALTLQMRAESLLCLKRLEEGLVDIKAAHALNPASAEICNRVGVFLAGLGRDEEALPWYDRSLDLQPGFIEALSNRAFALNHLHRFAECLELCDRIRTHDPNNMKAVFQASLVHLVTGNFEAGWAEREARWAITGLPIDGFGLSQPAWLGREPIDGKTFLVFEDEGAGDTIQFARYVPMLTARGARVILSVTDPLRPLLAGMPGIAQCVSRSVKPLPAFDLHCPITSLPLAFETRLDTIPSGLGYLPQPEQARQQMWEARLSERLGNDSRLRVGLVWSGNPSHVNDHNRSIPLRMLSGLFGA